MWRLFSVERRKMPKGIVGKIWNVKAISSGRSASTQISDSINYITNSEKCDMKLSDDNFAQIGRELNYITNDIKTLMGLYVGGRHITDVANATEEMMSVKEFFGKTGGRVALHGIVSLPVEESYEKNAGKLILLLNDLMQEVFPKNQLVYAVHTNTENLHIHFVVNTVGLDGKKIHMDKNFMRDVFEAALNKYALKYGFTPNEEWIRDKKKDPLSVVERRVLLIKIMDEAIEHSESFDEFIDYLKAKDIKVNVGKHMSVQMEGMPKSMRTYQLGSAYTIEGVTERIASKRNPFKKVKAGNYTKEVDDGEGIWYKPDEIKKYKDMTKEEQKNAVHLLKLGRNPWMETKQRNWQLERISKRLSMDMYAVDIISTYSEAGNIEDAKSEIIKRQKMLSTDRKEIKVNLKAYKPIIDLYEEMKKYEKRAYLYEFYDCKEYASDYEKYKELTTRLRENYNKSIEEVAEFIEANEGELMYIKAQEKELSEQYRAIRKYEIKINSKKTETKMPLFQAIGHSDAKEKARLFGVLSTRLVFLVSEENPGIMTRVLTTPDVVDGKATVNTKVSIVGKDGNVLEEFDSKQMEARAFNQKINETANIYKFKTCHVLEKEDEAAEFMREHEMKMDNKEDGKTKKLFL